MTEPHSVVDQIQPLAEPTSDLDAPPSPIVSERDDANSYAAYWQARSGLFDPISETDQTTGSGNGNSHTVQVGPTATVGPGR